MNDMKKMAKYVVRQQAKAEASRVDRAAAHGIKIVSKASAAEETAMARAFKLAIMK